MFTVALATDDGITLPLAATTDDITDIVAEIADESAQFMSRLDWATELRDRIVTSALEVGLDVEAAEMRGLKGLVQFDRLKVSNGFASAEYHLHSCGRGAREQEPGFAGSVSHRSQFKKGDAPRDYHGRWCKGAQCQAAPTGGLDDGLSGSSGPVSVGQNEAARDDIAASVAAAGTDLDARAEVLSGLDSTGPASTVAVHDRLPGDRYTAEREELHNEIIGSYFAEHGNVPHDRKAIVVGGLPGSGKSTALGRDDLDMHKSDYMHLDPDEVKQSLLDRNAVPRVKGLTDGEHAALVHEESSHIAGRIQDIAVSRGMNVIVDKTMGKPPRKELSTLRANGYSVRGVFVDIPVDESHYSARQRWQRGGRFIPPSYIESSRGPGGESTNKGAFRSVAADFDDWLVIDNSGLGTPRATPRGTVIRGAGAAGFAQAGMVVFRSTAVPRDREGQWCKGDQCAPGLAASNADIVFAGRGVTVSPAVAVPLIEDLGQRPTSSDLTKVTIEGHPHLFGAVAENQLRRVDMPQIPTERLDGFGDYLHERGVTTRIRRVDPADLRATQNELDGRKVGQMMTAMRTGTMVGAEHPLWVSSDNRILDGHHRWAAEAALSVGEAPRRMTVVQASVPMSTLLSFARVYSHGEGIGTKRHGMSISQRVERFAASVPRDASGQWCKGAQCQAGDHSSPGKKAAHTKQLKATAAAQAAGTGMPTAAEFDEMEKVGGPLGSNGGQWYRDENGQKYLVKPAMSEAHAHNELAAGLTYEHLGVPVNGTGVFERDGQHFVSKRAVEGDIIGMNPTPDLQMQARQGFHADTLTSSWDTFGLVGDNTLVGRDGQVYRIDVGGSNMFRAQGGDKPSFNPGKAWVEPDTMRSSNQGRKLYGNMSDREAGAQLAKLQDVNLPALDARLRSAGVIDSVRERTMATYDDRIRVQLPSILQRYNGG